MTTLLVLLEVNPDKSNLLVVPPSHVLNLMFTHEQTSELEILESGHHIGNLMLQPKLGADPDGRALGFLGNMLIRLPDSPKKQRVAWDGTLMMDHTLATTGLELTINLQDPPYHVHLGFDQRRGKAECQVKQADQTINQSSFSLDQAGLNSLLREAGLDPGVFSNIPATISAPTISAKQTELMIRKEKIIAYLVSIKQGETTLAEIYVSQLGQVLTAKTITGYSFATEDLMPTP